MFCSETHQSCTKGTQKVSYFVAKDELEKMNEKEVGYKNDDNSRAMKPLIYIFSQAAFNQYANYYISRMHLATGNDLFCSFRT